MSSSIRLKGRQTLKSISSTLDPRKVARKLGKDTSSFNFTKNLARQNTHNSLSTIFNAVLVRDEEDIYLEDKVASDLCIALCDLQLENEGPEDQNGSSFFSPMSLDKLNSFPFDQNYGATEGFLRAYDCQDGSKPSTAGSLLGELTWLVGGGRRIFPEGNRKTYLHRAVNWKNIGLCPEILREDLYDAIDSAGLLRKKGRFGRIFKIANGYCAVPWSVRVNEPHTMVTINHNYTADEKISRAEILTIVAVMMTQLEHEHLEEHCIPPVMVVSFMDSLQGRILQAHVTDSQLVIKKSKLYDFDEQADCKRSMTLFTQHMACDRIGNTRQIVSFDEEETKRKTAKARDMEIREKNIPSDTDPKFEGEE
ncbi:hypothetical protein DTO027B5_7966 [Paecilomyces variotii]|nr:hypothetical protein DTO027B3_5380 [Paecilomyces variotii]KAJ9330241.1 hypothetical protein DTO027B5_7966 [Paecilomyces variotii]